MTVRLPIRFFDDHRARDLPIPTIERETRRHVWVEASGPGWDDLLSDARYYADEYGPDDVGLRRAARALLAVIARRQEPK